MSRKLWLTWETQRRNNELADAFQCELLAFDYSAQPRWKRYITSSFKTVQALFQRKPEVVVAQCPSIALVTLVALLKPLFRFHLVIDAHNAFFDYANSSNPLLALCARLSARRSSYIIISNGALTDRVHLLGGLPLILPDKIPSIMKREVKPTILSDVRGKVVTCICSFAADEPLTPLLDAASRLSDSATFFITGKREKAGSLLSFESTSIRFTGYLPEEDYLSLLSHSDLIVDVTTRPDCLLCGAYEALALEVPSLLSDTPALRDAFGEAAVFSANTTQAFEETLKSGLAGTSGIRMNIPKAREEFDAAWGRLFLEAEQQLESLR